MMGTRGLISISLLLLLFFSDAMAFVFDSEPCAITKTVQANQWTQIGIPCESPAGTNTVEAILGDDMTGIYNADWNIFFFNLTTDAYEQVGLDDSLAVGKGYWIIQLNHSAILDMPTGSQPVKVKNSSQCITSGCFEATLVTNGDIQWQMLANPFYHSVAGADLRVNIGAEAGLTLQEASTETLAHKIWSYNGAGYDELQNQPLAPWTAAWFMTLATASIAPPPKLLFPTPDPVKSKAGCATGFLLNKGACVPDPKDKGTTYFVRTDGGTHTQCDGLSDTAYDGSSNQCAWDHPWRAMPPKWSLNTSPFKGGDTLIIADGEYGIGFGVMSSPGTADCSGATSGKFGCGASSVPSGRADDPTRILGENFNLGCKTQPQLWGTYRTDTVFNLINSDHVVLNCLDITDHAQCSRFHNSLACDNEIGVVEGYAYVGITAADSKNVLIRDVQIHGLDTGIWAGRIENWSLERVSIRGNKDAGWNGDINGQFGGESSSNTGDIRFVDGSIEWSGCIEPYPNKNDEPIGCISQDRGGYGDGLGTGATAGRWFFENFDFLFNVSDGLDLLYLSAPGQMIIKGGRYEGNAGNAIKVAGGGHQIENVEIIGNCGFFNQEGKWPDMVNHCRAGGSPFVLEHQLDIPPPNPDAAIRIINVSVWSEGDCAIAFNFALDIKQSIFRGAIDFLQPFQHACFAYPLSEGVNITAKDVVIYGFKPGYEGCEYGINTSGEQGHCVDPSFVHGGMEGSHVNINQMYDLRLADESPFKNYTPALGFINVSP